MATLQKFKLLATQCGVAQSPTRSPRTSPLVHVPRPQKTTTLRMLLSLSVGRRRNSADRHFFEAASLLPSEKKTDVHPPGHKLKDLFGSSDSTADEDLETEQKAVATRGRNSLSLAINVAGGSGSSPRRGFVGLRYRALLKKSWRPVLATIPE